MVQDVRRSATMIFAVAAAVWPTGLAGASSAAAGTHVAAGARAAALGGTWGTAIEVPGTAALNQGGNAQIESVSCGSAGNCSAGGFYTDSSGRWQALVAGETNGTWHAAIEVPGTAALNQGGRAIVNSVSCVSAGNCSAGGLYQDGSGHFQAFVAGETNGTWHTAMEVPGTAALNKKGDAGVDSVSCASAGNCSAGGFYTGGTGLQQAMVAGETNGTWHSAIAVPGTVALNKNGGAAVNEVSCASAGNCSAGGTYSDGAGRIQAFVAVETNGAWHSGIEVPGTAALNQGGDAEVNSVSCGSAGNCSAGGFYTDSTVHSQAFTAGETNGTWHTAKQVPGTATLNQGGGGAHLISLSCASAGNCSAGGLYTDSANHSQVFVASETNGTWRTAIEVPGTAALNQRGDDWISSVSCASAGNCSAGGYYAP